MKEQELSKFLFSNFFFCVISFSFLFSCYYQSFAKIIMRAIRMTFTTIFDLNSICSKVASYFSHLVTSLICVLLQSLSYFGINLIQLLGTIYAIFLQNFLLTLVRWNWRLHLSRLIEKITLFGNEF